MKCYACGSEKIESSMSQCPECAFPVMTVAGDTAQFETMMKQMAEEYRGKKIGGSALGLLTYQYAMKNDHLVLDKESETALSVDVTKMTPGQIWWDKTDFARVDAGEPLSLTLSVKKDGKVRNVTASVKAPAGEGFWHVGIRMQTGFCFSVLVGNEKNFAESGRISLVG